ncbi:hypothetical protein HAX54_045229 [Datura stramonium]|uniref:Uncharacterized protein n=1 Tax=Datura stramonium TaxID=4076 RepID=A0ABS8RH52_DATST|nr:hypothetical protein [Datura stramonium]
MVGGSEAVLHRQRLAVSSTHREGACPALSRKKGDGGKPDGSQSLIEIMTWEEEAGEMSRVVGIHFDDLAHQVLFKEREKMAKAGIVPVLLEVALLGSSLAQKRALKLLQWFKDERQSKMGPHSGPQVGRRFIQSRTSLSNAVEETTNLSSEQQHPASELSNISEEEDNKDELPHSNSSSLVFSVENEEFIFGFNQNMPMLKVKPEKQRNKDAPKCEESNAGSKIKSSPNENLELSQEGFCESDWEMI